MWKLSYRSWSVINEGLIKLMFTLDNNIRDDLIRSTMLRNIIFLIGSLWVVSGLLSADISIETILVGAAGNTADVTGHGAVNYEYSIGKYEVSNSQYVAFLNTKATSDSFGLYDAGMDISRSGSDGSYTYSTPNSNHPVTSVSFWNAARFSNWLHNGQGAGDTEDGAYTLTVSGMTNNTITRNSGATWAITSESEWYKAAYYDADSSNYFTYATSSNTAPTGSTPTAVANSANYQGASSGFTDVGSYTASGSPYGTFDQNGNAWEWNESAFGADRGIRGGSKADFSTISLRKTAQGQNSVTGTNLIGFRLVQVPEPGTTVAVLAFLAGIAVFLRRRMF